MQAARGLIFTRDLDMTSKQKETAVQEIDIETAQMVIKVAEEKKMKEFLRRYEELCKEFGYAFFVPDKLGVRKL
jgi:thiamine monophosphate synthase